MDNRCILITGGGSGIGLATARACVESGARVVVTGRDEDKLVAVRDELGSDRILAVPADVSRPGDVGRVVEAALAWAGRLDGVVANAATPHAGSLESVTTDQIDAVLATNVRGVYETIQAASPHLPSGGSVVVVGSWLTHRPMAAAAVYVASKAAVTGLAKALAPELATRGVRINVVTPGHIDTPMFAAAAANDEIRQWFTGMVPLGEVGHPAAVADVIEVLLGGRTAYMTGSEVVVDGGLSAGVNAA